MLSSFSPLMVAPTLPTIASSPSSPTSASPNHHLTTTTARSPTSRHVPTSQHTTCRIIVGPTDADYVTVIIGPSTTVHQLKLDAIKHIAARDHLAASDAYGDAADQWMVVRRLNPRALMMASYGGGGSGSVFLPQVGGGSALASSAHPFNTMVPGFTPPYGASAASTLSLVTSGAAAAGSSVASPTSTATAARPPPPARAAPKKPGTSGNSPVSTAPTSPTSASAVAVTQAVLPHNSSSSAVSSAATSPRGAGLAQQQLSAASTTSSATSISFPLSMFSGGGTLMRLDDNDIICGRHDDARFDLMLERVTDDVHIRLSIDDEQQPQTGNATMSSLLPLSSDMERTQSQELASHLAPSTASSASASATNSVFSFPMTHSLTASSTSLPPAAAAAQSTADLVERESDLSAGLDVCVMSVHGTYLQSAGRGDLRVACLDNCATLTLVDSAACDENGQCYRYLRTERGEYLAADSQGTLALHDINQPMPARRVQGRDEEEKTSVAATATDHSSGELGLLTRDHRWTIKRGPVQSLVSAHSHYLTIADDGDITLTPVRYEESCLHICFAILQGALRKKQERGIARLRRWQSKWFVLSGSTLTFYEQQDDIYNRDYNAAIASKLKQQQSSSTHKPSTSHDAAPNHNTYSTAGILSINVHPAPSCRFDVEFVNGRVLEVKAGCEAERERWVGALRNGKVGKRMDAKAKEGKKKKERQQTLRQKQTVAAATVGNPNSVNKQRWDGEEKTQHSQDVSLSSVASAVNLKANNNNRRQAAPLRIQTNATTSSATATPSHSTNTATTANHDNTKQPLAITVTHHPGSDTPSAALTATSPASASNQPLTAAHHAHKPSTTSSPELSLYKSAVGGVSPYAMNSASPQSQSGAGTPMSSAQRGVLPAFVGRSAPKAVVHRRRSLSIG